MQYESMLNTTAKKIRKVILIPDSIDTRQVIFMSKSF